VNLKAMLSSPLSKGATPAGAHRPREGQLRLCALEQRQPRHLIPDDEPPMRALLVTDLEAFTNTLDRIGDRCGQALMKTHNAIVRVCISEAEGSESAHTGDGVIASFPAIDGAVRCAIAMQRMFASHNCSGLHEPLHVRMGIHAGRPLIDDGRLFGKCVNTAVRVCQAARAGRIVTTGVVARTLESQPLAVNPLGRRLLKGLSEPFDLYELEWLGAKPGVEPPLAP